MVLPNLLGLGAMKCGTTTLYEFLRDHPEVYVPSDVKEVKFFSHEDRFAKGPEWYSRFFVASVGEGYRADVTPEYLFCSRSPARVAKTLEDGVRFIVLLRDPVSRAYSHYHHVRLRGFEDLEFEDALAAEPHRTSESQSLLYRYSYVGRSLYGRQLKRWFDWFPRDLFLVLTVEEDLENSGQGWADLQRWLGLTVRMDAPTFVSNAGCEARVPPLNRLLCRAPRYMMSLHRVMVPSRRIRKVILDRIMKLGAKPLPKLSAETRRRVFREYFEGDMREVERVLDRSFGFWVPEGL